MRDDPADDFGQSEEDLVEHFYRCCYAEVFQEGGIAGAGYRLTHRLVERGQTVKGKRVLEIGAGMGQHLSFVSNDFLEYVMLDPNLGDLPQHLRQNTKVKAVRAFAESPDLDLGEFDRVISMCVMHHVDDVAEVLRNVKKWLRPGGLFSLFLPCDPGPLNRINRKLFVERRSRAQGFRSYDLVNAREHRNHFWGIRTELLFQFRDYRIRRTYFPSLVPIASLNLFSVWHFEKPLT